MYIRFGRCPLLGVTLLAAFLVGCRPTVAASSFANSGISYDFGKATLNQWIVKNDDVQVKANNYTFQNTGNQLYLNGKSYGLVKRGDKVQVKENLTVFVNGVQR